MTRTEIVKFFNDPQGKEILRLFVEAIFDAKGYEEGHSMQDIYGRDVKASLDSIEDYGVPLPEDLTDPVEWLGEDDLRKLREERQLESMLSGRGL